MYPEIPGIRILKEAARNKIPEDTARLPSAGLGRSLSSLSLGGPVLMMTQGRPDMNLRN